MGEPSDSALTLVSAAFDLSPLSHSIRARVQDALAIVDGVHLASRLPRIPVDHIVDPDARAQYRMQPNRGRALGIGIDRFEPHVELAIVHEIGHFLDHQAIGKQGGFASNRHSNLNQWRKAVGSTNVLWTLRKLDCASRDVLADLLGRAAGAEDRERIESLLRYTEIWARCYAQYIVMRSASSVLASQMVEELAEADPIQSLGFWDDSAFLPIGSAIDDLFRQKGWIDEHIYTDRHGG